MATDEPKALAGWLGCKDGVEACVPNVCVDVNVLNEIILDTNWL